MRIERPPVVAFAVLLLVLAVTSPLRLVGDGGEYLLMAQRLGHLRAVGGVSAHFWLYSAMAAPFVRLADGLGFNPLAGFTVLNAALLLAAFAILLPRAGGAPTLLLMVGPVLWWLDKAHTEAFSFALLTIAFALMRQAPWWAMAAFGLAATQNLPMAAGAAITAIASLAMRRAWLRDWRWWAGATAAAAFPLLVVSWNAVRYGRLTPLAASQAVRIPLPQEIGALVWDPNLGLLVNFVAWAPAVALLVVWLAVRHRRALVAPEVAAALLIALALIFGAAQATNVNHGGTPGMSRYVVWLFPVAVPLFIRARPVLRGAAARALWMAAAVSAVWSLVYYQPRLSEGWNRPSALARYLWTHAPGFNDPLPEVFSERLSGSDEGWAPVHTPGCEKILLVGRGRHDGMWPLACQPSPVPPACEEPGRACYANRSGAGYRFVVEARSLGNWLRYRRQDTWPLAAERVAAEVFARIRAWELTAPADMVRGESIDRLAGVQGDGRLVAGLRGVHPGAAVIVHAMAPMQATFVNAETGDVLSRATVPAGECRLAAPQAPTLILTLEAVKNW